MGDGWGAAGGRPGEAAKRPSLEDCPSFRLVMTSLRGHVGEEIEGLEVEEGEGRDSDIVGRCAASSALVPGAFGPRPTLAEASREGANAEFSSGGRPFGAGRVSAAI